MLDGWLKKRNKAHDGRAELLRALNDEIGEADHDFKVGPSYLMRPGIDRDGGLSRVWDHDLLPLLEEHYAGRLSRKAVRSRFGLPAIRRRAGVEATSAGQEDSTDTSTGQA